jgi:CubicO group peptidase (beta-lactamase class C family)
MLLKKISLTLLAALLLPSAALAQNTDAPKLPDTLAGRRVEAYIKAFNSGDEQLMRAFFEENVAPTALQQRPAAARLEVYRGMRSNMEGLELRRISGASSNAVRVLVQTKKGEWLELSFKFEQDPPHKLLGLRVEGSEAPQGAGENVESTSSLTEAEAVKSIEKHLDAIVAADEFSGVVLLARGGRPIFQKAYGLASQEYNTPNRIDTKFNLGSINKIFTQIAIGQLVEQGKLSFDDKLGKYLPDYPNRDAVDKVTIRHLLNMSSGIGDFFGPEFEATPKDRLRKIKDFLPLFASKPLAFEPGSKRLYSNGGYIILGAIIEKVSGQDYYEYVREHIFKPTGMQDTAWYETDIPTPNMASGYTRRDVGSRAGNSWRNNLYTRPAKGNSAGGGYSTAEDLLKFASALQTQKLRIPDFREGAAGAKQNSSDRNPGSFSGIGIAGGASGINAALEAGEDGDYTSIVMSNYDPPTAEKVGKQIRRLLERVKK